MQSQTSVLFVLTPGVEEAFFTLARYFFISDTFRDIKKRLIDTAGKEEKTSGAVNVNQKASVGVAGCC